MPDTPHIPSLEEAKAYIDAIDFSQVIDKIVKTKQWKKADVAKICVLYRNFLFLQKKYMHEFGALPPSEEIDEFWHNHILDTKKYCVDCEKIFGAYLHHYPYLGIDGKTNNNDLNNFFKKTQELHFQEFNSYINNVRHRYVKQLIAFCKLLFGSQKSGN